MTTPATVLVLCLVWGTVVAASALRTIAVAKDVQVMLFSVLTIGLAVIALAATWRLWSTRKRPAA